MFITAVCFIFLIKLRWPKTKILLYIVLKKITTNALSQRLTWSPGQTIATCQPNISQHCWAQHVACVWPPCCDMLPRVGCCWPKFDHFQTWASNTQHVATYRNMVTKRTQHVAPNNVAICWVDMLRSFGRGLTLLSVNLTLLLEIMHCARNLQIIHFSVGTD